MTTSRRWLLTGGALALLVPALIGARLYLNDWLFNHVNRVLNNIEGYQGSVAAIDVDLYRGAYRIHQLKLYKERGKIPAPFLDIDTVDFSIQWRALLNGRIVSDVHLLKPVINFAVNPAGTERQTGAGVDWNQPLKELMPIDINLVTFREGRLSYRDFSTEPQVNVFIHKMQGESRNLRNVEDNVRLLPSSLLVRGDSIGGGKLEIKGMLNILKPIPDMDLEMKLERVHLPALSNYSEAYAGIDIEEGTLNIYSELVVKDGRVSGYVKPLATDIALIDLREDNNPIELAWEAAVSLIVEIFTNQPKDQFATRVPLEGNLNDIETDSWSAVAGIVRNAFIEAFSRGIDRDVTFGAAETG